MKHTRLSHLALVLSLLLTQMGLLRSVRAQGASEPAEYRDTIREALAEYHAKNFPEARALFDQAHQLFPNSRTLRGLGMAAFELRNYRESIGFLQDALASEVKPLEGSLRSETERLLKRAERFVAKLSLTLNPPGTRVSVDDVPVLVREGEPLILDVGVHTLQFQADGHLPETRTLSVKGRERETWSVVLEQAPPPPEPVAAVPPPSDAARSIDEAPDPMERQPEARARPAYKNPWLWTGVGVLVVAAAVTAVVVAKRDPGVEEPQRGANTPEEGLFSALWSRP